MQLQLKSPPTYIPTKLKTLPLREQPAYRVASNALGCSLVELLAAVVGGVKQIEVAEGLLARFNGDVHRLYQAHVTEIASVHGVGQQTAVRLKAVLALGLKLQEPPGDRPVVNSPADAERLAGEAARENLVVGQWLLEESLTAREREEMVAFEAYEQAVDEGVGKTLSALEPTLQADIELVST